MTTGDCRCGCCSGISDQTPVRVLNRPGLGEIAYRAGTYASFRASMVAGLTRQDHPALAGVRTRDPADFSMSLIDAWAVAADVLTFYTERIANESYLGTATERRSVSGLTGLIGYRLGAGVAAQTTVAFTLATSPGSPAVVPIPRGAKAQSLPGPDQLPQTFETVEDLVALPAWNAPVVRQTEPRRPRNNDTSVLLAGAATGVNRGGTLLFARADATVDGGFCLVSVTSVRPDAARDRTAITFAPALSGMGGNEPVRVHVMRQRAALFGYNAPSPTLFVDDVKTALADKLNAGKTEWVFAAVEAAAVDLDGVYEGVTVGSPVVLTGADRRLATVTDVQVTARTDYAISAQVTELTLDVTDDDLSGVGGDRTRASSVLLRAEELQLAEVPVVVPVQGDTIELAAPIEAEVPRRILVRGRGARVRADRKAGAVVVFDDGTPAGAADNADLAVVGMERDEDDPSSWVIRFSLDDGPDGTITATEQALDFVPAHEEDPVVGETASVVEIQGATLLLAEPLTRAYDRHTVDGRSVEIWGNVAEATHGEAVAEVLGSGDASRAYQRFTLRRPPLTLVQAASATGSTSTLKVFVDDVEWHEVPTLFGRRPRDRVFTTTTTDDGKTVVQFGDGVAGARPPTGQDNVRATYRAGTGLAGLVAADQLSLLMTRPLGVSGVRNPLAAAGAQDPQVAANAADNAPRTVLTLDRIVSLRDYEDFTANVGGIGKAAATWTWDGVVRGVLLTVAGVDGAAIDEAGTLMDNLTRAVVDAGNPRVPLVIRPARTGVFTLEASLVLDPDYVPDPVLDAARRELLDHFSFKRRAFGQLVSLGEVDEVLHAVRGVRGVLVSRLHRTGEIALRNPFLLAQSPVPGDPPAAEGAEILTIDRDAILLEVIS
jgi:hypothetical protein